MRYRTLGKTNIEVSEIGFGAWAIGGGMWGESNDTVSLNALRKAIDLGVNFVDTAAVYGKGHSEQLIGKVYRERKGKFSIATKIPPKNWQWPARHNTPIREAFPSLWVRECTEKSLRNLNLDCVDIQQLHVWSPQWVHQTEWYESLMKLKQEGKIRFIGVSLNDHEPNEALDLVKSGMVDTVQVIYNVFDQSPEDQLLPLCKKKNVGVIARVPLDEGSLSGKFTLETQFSPEDWRKDYFTPHLLRETVERVSKLNFLVREEVKSLAVGALKFCLSNPSVSTVIPG
ncbi:MAG: aldo/keto reductase, partial [Elusimicrobia bacterium]|nr:aldo/keto reductase [Elusimicrobiota bacterium]